jgi:hypothetical protein
MGFRQVKNRRICGKSLEMKLNQYTSTITTWRYGVPVRLRPKRFVGW